MPATMNIKCPACDTEVPIPVKLNIGGHRAEDRGALVLDISVESVDYEPMIAHYAQHHAEPRGWFQRIIACIAGLRP